MKTFQRLTLTFLTSLALTTQISATSMTLETPSDIIVSGQVTTGTLIKTGTAKLTLTTADNVIDTVDIQRGTVSINSRARLKSTVPTVNFSSNADNIFEVNADATAPVDEINVTLGINGTFSVAGSEVATLGTLGGPFTLKKAGTGTLISSTNISGSSSSIDINEGTVSVASGNHFPLGLKTLSGGTLNVTADITELPALVAAASTTSELIVDDTFTATQAAPITGSGTVDKTGLGSLVLAVTGNTAPLTVSAGTVMVANATHFPTSSTTLSGGKLNVTADITELPALVAAASTTSELIVDDTFTATQAAPITGSGTVDKTGLGSLVLAVTGNTAPLTVSAGTVMVANATHFPTSSTTLSGGILNVTATISELPALVAAASTTSELMVDTGFTATQAAAITGTGTVEKTGLGSLVLAVTGNTAPLTVSAGTLKIPASISGGTPIASKDYFPAALTTIATGTTLETTDAVAALTNGGTIRMNTGSTLKLGGNWAHAITVGSAV